MLAGHTDIAVSEAISPDGQTLYTGSGDGTVITWISVVGIASARRCHSPQPIRPTSSRMHKLQRLPSVPTAAGWRYRRAKGVVRLWDLHTLRPAGPNLHGFKELDALSNGGAEDLAFSPDGDLLAAGRWLQQSGCRLGSPNHSRRSQIHPAASAAVSRERELAILHSRERPRLQPGWAHSCQWRRRRRSAPMEPENSGVNADYRLAVDGGCLALRTAPTVHDSSP